MKYYIKKEKKREEFEKPYAFPICNVKFKMKLYIKGKLLLSLFRN